MRILITGATGLIGNELVSVLRENNVDLHYLTTSKEKIRSDNGFKGYYWDPQKGVMDENALIGVDTIIHLAGASIDGRWTDAYKQEIIESRIFSSNLLFKILKDNPHQVKQIISASGIGIYPNSESKSYSESSTEKATDFLGRVVEKWESGVEKFGRIGIKVCILRTGMVLSDKGGALPQMAKSVAWGVGAAFGSGKQVQSWIHVEDLVQIYVFAVQRQLEGVFNAVAPNPVSNEIFTQTLAKVLSKKIILPNIPRFVMNLLLGEMHQLLYTGQCVKADKIQQAGFTFQYPELESAITDLLK